MPCIFLAEKRQIYLFIPTFKYALYIPGRYVTDLFFSSQLSMPSIFLEDTPQISLFLHTIKYALYVAGFYLTDLLICHNN